MVDAPTSLSQPALYWRQLEQLKAACLCMRLYRNELGHWVRGVEIVKAVASSGGIAGWVVWKDYPLMWAGIIAAAQLLDALKSVFPFARTHRGASDLTIALEIIYIDAEHEWEGIYAGKLSEAAINELSERLIRLATEEARTYFFHTFN